VPSLSEASPNVDELESLHKEFVTVGLVNGKKWPSAFSAAQAHIHKFLKSAYKHIGPATVAAGDAMVAAVKAARASKETGTTPPASGIDAGGSSGAAAATTATMKAAAGPLFTLAEKVNSTQWEAADRVKYEVIGTLYTGNVSRTPYSYPLTDFTANLTTSSAKDDSYTHMGVEYVRKDSASQRTKITTADDLWRQCDRRAQAKAVAGCFDANKAATDRNERPLRSPELLEESTKKYIAREDARDVVNTLSCFCTLDWAQAEVRRLKEFAALHPHVSVRGLMAVDARVQKAIANLKLKGYTEDAAIYQTCIKSPENYSVQHAATEGDGDDGGTADVAAAPRGSGKHNKRNRTEAERDQAAKTENDNLKRQIANLKAGKGAGKFAKGQKGAPHGWQQPYQQPYQQWQQWQPQGKGMGPGGPSQFGGRAPGPNCPPDVCADFNFKARGCDKNPCTRKHICALCGANHCFRGNH
jgi:hypothetical protein